MNEIKHIYFDADDASTWSFPADVVAVVRAIYYAQSDLNQDEFDTQKEYDKRVLHEIEYALENFEEIVDCVGSNMDWADVEAHARREKDPEPVDMAMSFRHASFYK